MKQSSRLLILLFFIVFSGCVVWPTDRSLMHASGNHTLNFQGTGTIPFPIGHIWMTRSYMEAPGIATVEDVSLQDFINVESGTFKNWQWNIQTQPTLQASYCTTMENGRGRMKWENLFSALQQLGTRVAGKKPPAFKWTIREIPAGISVDKTTYAYSYNDVVLTYYLAWPVVTATSMKHRINLPLWWSSVITYQYDTIAHEAYQALVAYGGLVPKPPSQAVQEAQATLFDSAAVMLAAKQAGDATVSFEVPTVENLSRKSLDHTPLFLGISMLSEFLKQRLGKTVSIQSTDTQGVEKLLRLTQEVVQHPQILVPYKQAAITAAIAHAKQSNMKDSDKVPYGYPVTSGGVMVTGKEQYMSIDPDCKQDNGN